MSGSVGYLLARSTWNRGRRLAAEFRRPSHGIALAAAVAYFALLAHLSPTGASAAHDTQAAAVVGAIGLLVLVVSAWLLGSGGKLVELSGAERTLLLPAPITAGRVMDVKLLRLQATALGNAVMWTALTSGGHDWPVIVRRAIAFWVLLTTVQLHRIAAARTRSVAPIHPALRRILGLLGIGLVASVPIFLSGAIGETAPGLAAFLGGLAHDPIARAMLWPFRLILGPLTATGVSDWIAQLGPALAVLALHYLWVRRLGPETERLPDALTSTRGAPLWPLGPAGPPATAFLWKNATALARRPTATVAAAIGIALLLLPAALRAAGRDGAGLFLGWLVLVWAALLLVVGPQFVRNDLRRDQGLLALLRTLPVRGHEIILGSAGAAALALAPGVSVLLLTGALATMGSAQPPLPEHDRLAWLVAALMTVGPLSLAGILIQNAAVILFPAWSRITARRGTATALGSNLANSALTLLALGVLLLLPLALASATWALAGGMAWTPILCGVAVAALLGAECWLLVRWLGARFESLDGATPAA